jgi:hypothetical protein
MFSLIWIAGYSSDGWDLTCCEPSGRRKVLTDLQNWNRAFISSRRAPAIHAVVQPVKG